jgi:hypothetical protein
VGEKFYKCELGKVHFEVIRLENNVKYFRVMNYWLYNNPRRSLLLRILETQAEPLNVLLHTVENLGKIYAGAREIRDQFWSSGQVKAKERGLSLNSILEKPCGNPDFTCLDGKWAAHPEFSYHIGHKRRKTIPFQQLETFLIRKAGENPQMSRDILWLISFCVFVANLQGRITKMLAKLGVVRV